MLSQRINQENQDLKDNYKFLGIKTEIQLKDVLTEIFYKQEIDDNLSTCVLALRVV